MHNSVSLQYKILQVQISGCTTAAQIILTSNPINHNVFMIVFIAYLNSNHKNKFTLYPSNSLLPEPVNEQVQCPVLDWESGDNYSMTKSHLPSQCQTYADEMIYQVSFTGLCLR